MSRSSGFTLIEVLIATSIFALISVITFQGIRSAMTVQERVEGHARKLSEMQLVWAALFQDFVNMARRPVREEGRGALYPAFDLGPDDDSDCVVSFTRGGLPPSSTLPSGMQRLAYCIREGDLYRAVWPVLDRSRTTEAQESLLMEDVSEFIVETIPDNFDPEQEKKGFEGEGASEEGDGEDESDEQLKQSAKKEAVKKHYELPVGVKVTIQTGEEKFERWFPGGEEYQLDIDEEE